MKKINKNSAALFAVAAIFMLMFLDFDNQQSRTEKLLGFSFNYDKKEVTIQVVSTGCTMKADFEFKVSNNNITIIRKKRDECKRMPERVSLTYTLAETGLKADKEYTVKNKFIPNLNIANIP